GKHLGPEFTECREGGNGPPPWTAAHRPSTIEGDVSAHPSSRVGFFLLRTAMPTTACPYCNAAVPVPEPVPADRRVPCPRCGEEVTVRTAEGAGGAPAPAGVRAAETPGAAT